MFQALHATMHRDKKMKLSKDTAATASFIPFGSFALPDHEPEESYKMSFTAKSRRNKIGNTQSASVVNFRENRNARPLHACPGLPKPNQEMKYHHWGNKGGISYQSGINLSQMTHCDHSQKKNRPEERPKSSTPEMEEESKTVVDDELNAVITLSSCFKTS